MQRDLPIDERRWIPGRCLSAQFARSGGPGGQHVQTTDTKVLLTLDLHDCTEIPEGVRARLAAAHPGALTTDGRLQVRVDTSRSQWANLQEARERLAEWVRAVLHPPKPRVATRPTRASQGRRVAGKKTRGTLKSTRSRVREEGE